MFSLRTTTCDALIVPSDKELLRILAKKQKKVLIV